MRRQCCVQGGLGCVVWGSLERALLSLKWLVHGMFIQVGGLQIESSAALQCRITRSWLLPAVAAARTEGSAHSGRRFAPACSIRAPLTLPITCKACGGSTVRSRSSTARAPHFAAPRISTVHARIRLPERINLKDKEPQHHCSCPWRCTPTPRHPPPRPQPPARQPQAPLRSRNMWRCSAGDDAAPELPPPPSPPLRPAARPRRGRAAASS